ncbi:MAG: GNAT family N-acetyltransferase [Acidimicrobiia bacterium]|nr:GNAT family N-acetyltransferase [Acidimicrobiia bacterium]
MEGSLPTEDRRTERFVLRPFRRRDAEPLHEAVAASLSELNPWLPWAHEHYSRLDAVNYIKDSARSWREGHAFDFAIRGLDDPDLHLGNVSVWYLSRGFRSGEVGYWVRTDIAGTGVASEVARRVLRIGFEELGLHRVILRIAIGNRASERVAEKLGFTREGVLREEIKVRGTWLDHSVWGLLEHEYHRLHSHSQIIH